MQGIVSKKCVSKKITLYGDDFTFKWDIENKRKILLLLTQNLHYDGHVHMLLRSLSEIQRILYLGDDFRTSKEILQLHTFCFEHFVILKKIMPLGIA